MKHSRMAGIVGFIFFALVVTPGSPRAQSVNDLQKELQEVLQELAERVREAGAQWRQSLRLDSIATDRPLSFMLEYQDALELSPHQINDLKKLRSRFEREAIRREADIKVARMELDELLEADAVDLAKTEKKVRELERLRGDEKLSRIRVIETAKALLRPDQRKKLTVLEREHSVN